jgi:hypothetical protein
MTKKEMQAGVIVSFFALIISILIVCMFDASAYQLNKMSTLFIGYVSCLIGFLIGSLD